MKKYPVILILCTAILMPACDFLNKKPHTLVPETYFSTDVEVNSFLLGIYSPLMQNGFYGNQYPTYLAGGDDLSFYQRSTAVSSILCANANSGNSHIDVFWTLLYQGINRANMLMENLDGNTAISTSVKNSAYAQALFLRAFYYFHLVQGWGDVPLRLEATKTVIGLDAPRTDKETIYNMIVEDMEESIANLPDFTANITCEFVSKSAAQGLLARVWLFRAGECYRDNKTPDETYRTNCFTQARKWALAVKDSSFHGLVKPYSRIFIDYGEDKYNSTGVYESMWEVAESGNNSTSESAAGRIGNTIGFGGPDFTSNSTYCDALGLANPGYSYKFIYASLKLYEMYETEGDTARGDWNITPFEYKLSTKKDQVLGREFYYGKMRDYVAPSGFSYTEKTKVASDINKTRCAAKYRREYETVSAKNKNFTPINFPILRYSDVLLMLAEAENEVNGPTALAYECINAVRNRADIPDLTAGLDKDAFRTAIKKERAMELCFEALRRWDLIRWGDFVSNMREMESYVYRDGWGNSYTYAKNYYNVSSAYNYFPIPDTEMSLNKQITQNNPGW